VNAWWCPCGEYGVEPGQPAAARMLTEHLISAGHRSGEYFYGCQEQRTSVEVRLDGDGRPRHRLLPR
jgi:DNA-binding LacI/PurR family transcriptional regulator